ncbi:MAG: YchJ family protein [Motiliproteus sp.]
MLHDQLATATPCPCGSSKDYNQCCEAAIEGTSPSATAEQLMRSRYTAFAIGMSDYLFNSTHPDYRQELTIDLLDQYIHETTWTGLEIIDTEQGAEKDQQGTVTFVASFNNADNKAELHEKSRFIRENEHWYYLDGDTQVIEK